jgi:arsenate reductase-like glutaredoxin family protein
MNVQIFGRRDCSESRKAERWFKERKIPFQFIDIKVKGLAPREFEGIAAAVGVDNLLDRNSKRFLETGLSAAPPSRIRAALASDSLLLKTPMVRNGREATLGVRPEVWAGWK